VLAFYVKLTLPPLLRSSQNQCRAANVHSSAVFYCICRGKYYPTRGVLFPFPIYFLQPPPHPCFKTPPSHPFPPLPSDSLHDSNPSLLHYSWFHSATDYSSSGTKPTYVTSDPNKVASRHALYNNNATLAPQWTKPFFTLQPSPTQDETRGPLITTFFVIVIQRSLSGTGLESLLLGQDHAAGTGTIHSLDVLYCLLP
jgi:hypothetical protein